MYHSTNLESQIISSNLIIKLIFMINFYIFLNSLSSYSYLLFIHSFYRFKKMNNIYIYIYIFFIFYYNKLFIFIYFQL